MDAPLKQFSGATELEAELASQVDLLEAMFDDPGLARLGSRCPGHPALRRYASLLAGSAVPPDEDQERTRLQDLSQGFLDRSTWAQDPNVRPFWRSTVPDANQAVQAERRISNPEQFGDTTLELFAWGALRAAGLRADLQERDGQPDIRVSDSAEDTWLEVKRLHLGSPPARARSVLSKANAQIKNAMPNRAGAAYLFVETTGDAAVFDDAVPQVVDQFVAEVHRTLGSSVNSHVAQVVIGWDDFIVLGHFPEPVMYAIRRRTLVLDRTNPVLPVVAIDWSGAFGFSSVVWIRPTSSVEVHPALVSEGLVATELFQQRNNWADGIRVTQARGILTSPDAVVEVPLAGGGMSVVLATKRVDLTRPPHVTLLIGCRNAGGRLTLSDGFRIQGSEHELEAWKADPSLAFDDILRRFGLPISVGSGPAELFHLHVSGASPAPISTPGITDNRFMVSMFTRFSPGLWEADWVYAINDTAYRATYNRTRLR